MTISDEFAMVLHNITSEFNLLQVDWLSVMMVLNPRPHLYWWVGLYRASSIANQILSHSKLRSIIH